MTHLGNVADTKQLVVLKYTPGPEISASVILKITSIIGHGRCPANKGKSQLGFASHCFYKWLKEQVLNHLIHTDAHFLNFQTKLFNLFKLV